MRVYGPPSVKSFRAPFVHVLLMQEVKTCVSLPINAGKNNFVATGFSSSCLECSNPRLFSQAVLSMQISSSDHLTSPKKVVARGSVWGEGLLILMMNGTTCRMS